MSRKGRFSPNRKLVVSCTGAGASYHSWKQDETHRWCRNCGIDWYRATKG